jgi:hypothetical protein
LVAFLWESRESSPKKNKHRIGRRMPIIRPSMHFTTGYNIHPGYFLIEYRCLSRTEFCVSYVCF